jgi:catechol 2,3-dioxygenase-like lactoylglutathione lyase family enzyme
MTQTVRYLRDAPATIEEVQMARRFSVTFDTADPAAEAGFWAEVLGYRLADAPPEDVAPDEHDDWAALADPEGSGPGLFFQRVPEGKVAKNRVHLDIEVGGDGPYDERKTRIAAERDRLVALGASDRRGALDEPPSYWVRMNDPEDNEFCLV